MNERSSGDLPSLVVEPMTSDDLEAVRPIYTEGIATGNATFETEAPDRKAWDRGRCADCRLVARTEDRVVGLAALSPVSSRPVYAGVAEVSLYVSASARDRGVGTALLRAQIEASERAWIWTLQGALNPGNRKVEPW